jgi:hypothetical protein
MRKLWFLAPACVLLVVLPVLAAKPADSSSTNTKTDDAEIVELFDAMASGDLDVKVIAKDATTGKVLIKNTTKRPLAIKLPEVFAAVPAAAQFFPVGGPLGAGPGGLNNGLLGANGQGNQFQNQPLGGAFQGQQGLPGANGFFPGGGNGIGNGNFGVPGIFKVEPEKVGKLKITTVCLEHGKPDPKARIEYALKPLDSLTSNAKTIETVRMLARGEIDQKSAQAAAWHVENGLTWQKLARGVGTRHLSGIFEPMFTREQLKRAQAIVAEAEARAARATEKQDSLAGK